MPNSAIPTDRELGVVRRPLDRTLRIDPLDPCNYHILQGIPASFEKNLASSAVYPRTRWSGPRPCAARFRTPDVLHFHIDHLALFNDRGSSERGIRGRDQRSSEGGISWKTRGPYSSIDWLEPFGLVMIEAIACGTTAIAYDNGSVPEVIDDGLTSFLVGSIPEAIAALDRVRQLDRGAIRKCFEQRFTVERICGRLACRPSSSAANASSRIKA